MRRRKQTKHWTQPDITDAAFIDWLYRKKKPLISEEIDKWLKSAWVERDFKLRKPQFLDPEFLEIMLKDKTFWFGPEGTTDSEFYETSVRCDWTQNSMDEAADTLDADGCDDYVAGKGNTCYAKEDMIPVVEYMCKSSRLYIRIGYVYNILSKRYYSHKAKNCYKSVYSVGISWWEDETTTNGVQKFFSKKSSDCKNIKDWLKTKTPVEVEYTPTYITRGGSRELVA